MHDIAYGNVIDFLKVFDLVLLDLLYDFLTCDLGCVGSWIRLKHPKTIFTIFTI